jgi:hypothetical protein
MVAASSPQCRRIVAEPLAGRRRCTRMRGRTNDGVATTRRRRRTASPLSLA